jgi:hypothetical protein
MTPAGHESFYGPDINLGATQLYLTHLGFHPGAIDGIAGQHTLSALAEFQAGNHIQSTNVIDGACIASLRQVLTVT